MDCTPYPHYYDILLPVLMILAIVVPLAITLFLASRVGK